MKNPIHVAILEDHPAIADGYRFRISQEADMKVVAMLRYGADLEPMLASQPVDVLLLDMQVMTSPTNSTPFPTMRLMPELLVRYPDLSVLVISMYNLRAMIDVVLGAGVDGYILKDDVEAYRTLPDLIRLIASGGMYLSAQVKERWLKRRTGELISGLGQREIEALWLCAAFSDERLPELARRMNISNAAIRATLWDAYRKLGVNSRAAAVTQVRQMGIVPPEGIRLG